MELAQVSFLHYLILMPTKIASSGSVIVTRSIRKLKLL